MTTNRSSSAGFAAKATVAALALAGSLAAFAPAAQAQRIAPGPTTLDNGCYLAQQDYVDGVAEFKAAYAANDQAGMDAAGKKLRRGEDFWKTNCEAIYGSLYIAYQIPTRDDDAGSVSSSPNRGGTATLPPVLDTRAGAQ